VRQEKQIFIVAIATATAFAFSSSNSDSLFNWTLRSAFLQKCEKIFLFFSFLRSIYMVDFSARCDLKFEFVRKANVETFPNASTTLKLEEKI